MVNNITSVKEEKECECSDDTYMKLHISIMSTIRTIGEILLFTKFSFFKVKFIIESLLKR